MPCARIGPVSFAVSATAEGGEGERREAPASAATYRSILGQFWVECRATRRYRAAEGKTCCGTYVWDTSRSLGAELPHWIDAAGAPVSSWHDIAEGMLSGRTREIPVNRLIEWMLIHEGNARYLSWKPLVALSTPDAAGPKRAAIRDELVEQLASQGVDTAAVAALDPGQAAQWLADRGIPVVGLWKNV